MPFASGKHLHKRLRQLFKFHNFQGLAGFIALRTHSSPFSINPSLNYSTKHDVPLVKIATAHSRLHESMTLLSSDKGLLSTAKFLELSGALTSDDRSYKKPSIPDTSNTTDDELSE